MGVAQSSPPSRSLSLALMAKDFCCVNTKNRSD
uniref:Uncharacterized protein n=1 Tax=Anguilla anguilla TaxID=7936 RepID=A0A0E9RND7_ANGAN